MSRSSAPLSIRSYGDDFSGFDGKSVLVTGGTGSFGRAFVRAILDRAAPRRVVIFSRDEFKQHLMTEELRNHPKASTLRYFIGDVRDSSRLDMAFRDINYVIHAAAMKQVTTAEYNPFECIHTNVLGAENVVRAAINNRVEKVVALSTDKAASPINLYGASKLASDKIFVAANNLAGDQKIHFSVVRYGNVLGSRGSVVPLFEKLIAEGAKTLPITDDRMTRFWITLDQGVQFVVSSLKMMDGGEIFIPKIPSATIVELAKAMAPEIKTEVIGIRPGEKLHEVMITEEDARNTVEYDDRYVIEPNLSFWSRKKSGPQGKPVAEDFEFASNKNPEWISAEQLRELLAVAKH